MVAAALASLGRSLTSGRNGEHLGGSLLGRVHNVMEGLSGQGHAEQDAEEDADGDRKSHCGVIRAGSACGEKIDVNGLGNVGDGGFVGWRWRWHAVPFVSGEKNSISPAGTVYQSVQLTGCRLGIPEEVFGSVGLLAGCVVAHIFDVPLVWPDGLAAVPAFAIIGPTECELSG